MIGLLVCDHVRPQFHNIAGDYDAMFARWLPADWRTYDVAAGEVPRDLRECSAYITTGSRASVYDADAWIARFAELVVEAHRAGVPLFGVCFGHQMIAHALGGKVAKCGRGWGVGVHEFHVRAQEPWMQPPMPRFRVLMSCQDQVEDLPPGAEVLAGNEHCPIGMFRVGRLLGLQGHPEFPAAYAGALLQARRSLIGEQRADAALATLAEPCDSALLAEWARNFLS